MCLNPKKIYREGKYKEDNYNGKKGENYSIEAFAKCGSCGECIAEKANNWVIRNNYEAKEWKKICFITLTYKENPLFLVKKDLQDFIKRLRRNLEYNEYKEKIRYFAVGEYGTLNNRPHMHILIYNWEDKNAEYIRTNKKGNAIFKSELIEKIWGKGITSYQVFDSHEIPYISLYTTPQEKFKKAFKMKIEEVKKINEELKKNEKINNKSTRLNMIKTLKKEIEKAEKLKKEYVTIKEFNTWSTAIGWKKFKEQYNKESYTFNEYIEDKEFLTPTAWIKKLANKEKDENAIKEMKKRSKYEIEKGLTDQKLKDKNTLNYNMKENKNILKWSDEKRKIEDL